MENPYNRIRRLKAILKLPEKSQINSALSSFSKKERIIFSALVIILVLSTISILESINKHFMVSVPAYGGSISEGVIGTPRFVNPVLAFSDADQDLVSLIYSGLTRKSPDGNLIPDLAEKYEISNDGLSYTFTLKNNIYFHDGKPVTVDDIIFTIDKLKDSVIKSSRRGNWESVTVIKIDEKTIKFILKQSYASFLENTTLGIMPSYLWKDSPIELNNTNTNPIGSGPYMVSSVNKQSSGAIDYYELTAFKKFALDRPYIKNISLHFYLNEDSLIKALENKEVDQISSITPLNAGFLRDAGHRVESTALPRVFGLFFNQNINQLFVDKTVINAINQAIDKDKIVREVLGGYGVVIDDPIPPSIIEYQKSNKKNDLPRGEILKKIQESLAKGGWEKNSDGFLEKTVTEKKKKTIMALEFSISTSNAPELIKTAALIKQDLEAVGMKVEIKTFEVNGLNQDVIRPRKYDVLLFGQIINNESDLFAFWHSSQRRDPGLNVSMYTNANVDKILENAFVTIDKEARSKKYVQFEDEIKKDMPVVFLYTPKFIYIVSNNLKGILMNNITSSSNRFLDIYSWYTKKNNVWRIFTNNKALGN